jgi:hypothetical protein
MKFFNEFFFYLQFSEKKSLNEINNRTVHRPYLIILFTIIMSNDVERFTKPLNKVR